MQAPVADSVRLPVGAFRSSGRLTPRTLSGPARFLLTAKRARFSGFHRLGLSRMGSAGSSRGKSLRTPTELHWFSEHVRVEHGLRLTFRGS
jgi:hypothetical protein